jgi:diguanylate cyclase (GGDEF)-like protein
MSGSESPEQNQASQFSDRDPAVADRDQMGSDLDQETSAADELASARDQIAADRDQATADRDQEIMDLSGGASLDTAAYVRSQRARFLSAQDRDVSAHARSEATLIRDANAHRRDQLADERDAAARERDQLAAAQDADLERHEVDGDVPTIVPAEMRLRITGERNRAAQIRARAALQREQAARDREQAACDRDQAARDRQAAIRELEMAGIDHLTGALRRHIGLAAIQRELDRTARSHEQLVVAFVDVDSLKRVNDTKGHGAGDGVLRDVVGCIKEGIRSYDLVTRFGGDEFVCLLTGHDAEGAARRFEEIGRHLAKMANHPSITVGLAERRPGESLDELIVRADSAMIGLRAPR